MRTLAATLVLVAWGFGGQVAISGEVWVGFLTPKQDAAAIGEIEVEATVLAAKPIRDVVFYLDGRPVGMLAEAPYRLHVDLGSANRAHTLEVIATDTDGDEARSTVTTQPAPIGGSFQVDLQQLYITATRGSERVLDLERGDFRIQDDGRDQRIVTFARGDIPFTAVLLLDASASMYGSKLEAARVGATAFIDRMHELDRAKVIVFSDVMQASTPFSGTPEMLTAGLSGVTGEGGTALNDHLFTALELLESRQGRRVVVVLSDGVDSDSVLSMRHVQEYARRAQALIYWIRLLGARESAAADAVRMSSAWRGPEDYRQQLELMDRTVSSSGGRTIVAHGVDEVAPIFVEVLRELREQYAIGYYPDNLSKDGRWHRVKVVVDRPAVTVRTHEGYIDR